MKTLEQFLEQKERSRGTRPGDANFFPYDCYLGIIKEETRSYQLLDPDMKPYQTQFDAYSAICDLMERYPQLSFDLNFSDNIADEEREFILRMCNLAQGRMNYREQCAESARETRLLQTEVLRRVPPRIVIVKTLCSGGCSKPEE